MLIKGYLFYLVFIVALVGLIVAIFSFQKDSKTEKKEIKISRISRSVAYNRGMDMINYVWEYNGARNGIEDNVDIKLPFYLEGKSSVKVSGIPYCWGGYIGLDISNQNDVKNFQDAIEKGYIAGNVNCSGGYKDLTAGLDCSGFVCAVFKIPEKCSTKGLVNYFDEIDINELKPMDILNSIGNHVVIFIKESSDKKGVIVMESTTNRESRTKEKTVINFRSWDEIKKGVNNIPYTPMRYKKIVDDKVRLFQDQYEFNSTKLYSTNLNTNEIYKGYIDYVGDEDYYKFLLDVDKFINLNIMNIPKYCRITIFDDNDNIYGEYTKTGVNAIPLKKGTYYLKVEGIDFQYGEEEYNFIIHD
ncbi:hypothetical protein Q428_12165 [Fervidicella metallireducens AeB]|uniref:Uncharacterized protein n=1 Tax=Fervidicella metallireducens AeB TaxID=1403537 RepID=A0A017RSD0_9CLOT|nr:hypothetical protein [Fervidicella metallireducens]EYE87663.1 hypothetical protein Q428_12165 [Fervidicella metallireducens AeB]